MTEHERPNRDHEEPRIEESERGDWKEQFRNDSVDDGESEQRPTWSDRFWRIIDRPHSQLALVLLGITTFMAKGPQRPELPQKMMPGMRLQFEDATLHFEDWRNSEIQEADQPIRVESKAIKEVLELPNSYGNIENPIKVKDPLAFRAWLKEEANDLTIRQTIGLGDIERAEPRQLVALAAAIVTKNLNYDPQTSEQLRRHDNELFSDLRAGQHLVETSDTLPVDTLLMTKAPAICRHFSACTSEVYRVLKEMYPHGMANTYVQRAMSYELNHAWNAVIEVTGSNSADVSFIDPTAADNDWRRLVGPEDFPELLNDLNAKMILEDDDKVASLRKYIELGKASIFREWNIVKQFSPRNDRQLADYMRILEHLLSRPQGELEIAERREEGKDLRKEAFQALVDVYIDPENYSRPDDWYERAKSLAKHRLKFIKDEAEFQQEIAWLNRLPRTPEEYYNYKYQRDLSELPAALVTNNDQLVQNAKYRYEEAIKSKVPAIRAWAREHDKEKIWWRN